MANCREQIYDMVDRKQLIRDFRVMSQCVSNRLVTFLGATQGLTDSLGVYMEYMELGSVLRKDLSFETHAFELTHVYFCIGHFRE